MIGALAFLLTCQLVGEILVRLIGLPVPGPVVGAVLLFLVLAVRGGVPAPLKTTALGLLQHLSLLFVPAGVGVMIHVRRLEADWLAIAVALVASTWLTILVAAGVFRLCARLAGARADGETPD